MLASDPGTAALVDPDALQEWMAAHDLLDGPLELLGRLGGGTQNVLVRLRTGRRELVLRRGPQHLRQRTNEMLRREMRVLAALDGTGVPHARLVAACPEEDVLGGASFYLMEAVDGFNPTVGLSEAASRSGDVRRQVCLSTAEALAAVGAVDHAQVGLADFGNPDGFLERQVGRWRAELDSYSELDGYDGPALPGVGRLGGWLEENRPAHWTPGILHGDYHLSNVLCDHATGRVAAVVDWEMTTIGDPLLDLGVLLATWPRGDGPEVLPAGVRALAGVVTAQELVGQYANRSERDLSHVDWYVALACYKLAIVLEGTYARACAGLAPREVGDRLHTSSLVLLERARQTTGT
jgi:aminoglycoside phosphotransferase (APT) family kinase protein